jgi:hypothetical protein
VYRFKIEGRAVFCNIDFYTLGVSNALNPTVTVPVTAATKATEYWSSLFGVCNAGTWACGQAWLPSAGTAIVFYSTANFGAFTNGNFGVDGVFIYEI